MPDSLAAQVVEPIDPFSVASYQEGRALYLLESGKSRYVAFSFLKKALDDHRRPFIHNHTLFLLAEEYLRLGTHPQALESLFISPSSFAYTGDDIEPLSLDSAVMPASLPSEEDLQRIRAIASDPNQLAQVIAAIADRRKIELAIRGDDYEVIRFIYSLLHLLPPQLSTVPFASFVPRIDYQERFVLTAAPVSGRGPLFQVTARSGSTSPPDRLFLDLARAVHQGDMPKITSLWEVLDAGRAFSQALVAAKTAMASGQMAELKRQLDQLTPRLSSPGIQEEQRREYENLLLALHRQEGNAQEFYAVLERSQTINDKMGYLAQVLADAGVNVKFRYQLIAEALHNYQPKELESRGMLAFLFNSPATLAELVHQGTISMGVLLPAMAASHHASADMLLPIFSFDGSPTALKALESQGEVPFFVRCLNEIASLNSYQAGLQSLVSLVLLRYTDALREAFNASFRNLPRPQWPAYSRRVRAALQKTGVVESMRHLVNTWRAQEVSRKWEEFLKRLNDVAAGT